MRRIRGGLFLVVGVLEEDYWAQGGVMGVFCPPLPFYQGQN